MWARTVAGRPVVEVEYKEGQEWVIANKEGIGISIANYKSSSADAKDCVGISTPPPKAGSHCYGREGLHSQRRHLRQFW